jgi:hypothetical protein
MPLKTEVHISEYVRDEDTGPGESSLNGNIHFDCQGVTPNEKQKIRDILDRFYKEIRTELKTVVQ